MKQIKKKLHSNSGASMILALVLMLICVMVSSVIVVAAASGITRTETRLKKQQEYLAVTSAARFIAENLNPAENAKLCGVLKTNERPCTKYKGYNIPYQIEVNGVMVSSYAIPSPISVAEIRDQNGNVASLEQFYLVAEDISGTNAFCEAIPEAIIKEDATEFTGPFAELMKTAASEVFTNNVSYSETFTMDVGDARLPKVECKFKMEIDYSVSIIIQVQNLMGAPIDNQSSEYSMTVRMEASELVSTTEEEVECINNHRCFYEYCDAVGNMHTSSIELIKFQHKVNNATTRVTWGSPAIDKGGK